MITEETASDKQDHSCEIMMTKTADLKTETKTRRLETKTGQKLRPIMATKSGTIPFQRNRIAVRKAMVSVDWLSAI